MSGAALPPIPGGPHALDVRGPAPPGIPHARAPDTHAAQPGGESFEARRAAYLEHVRRGPASPQLASAHHELARLAAGGPAHVALFEAALDFVDARHDCADFVMHAVLRLLYQFRDDARLPPALVERAHRSVLGFKYWPDEPGVDSMCTWTENHQILFAGAAYLAGQLHPDEVFTNSGVKGRDVQRVARARIDRWLDLRFRTGFSEWLSNVYYDEDLVALLSLIDFADDPRLVRRAAMVTDLLFLDMALQSFRGVFGSTHGRSYEPSKKWCAEESTTDVQKLAFGLGRFAVHECMSAASLALSARYRVPAALAAIAADGGRAEVEVRQRMGIRIAEAGRFGLSLREPDAVMALLSLEAYAHPRTIASVMELFDRFGWWENEFFRPFARARAVIEPLRRARLLPVLARLLEHDLSRNLREEVNVYTYRTPDTMLSSARDWRPGYGGDQQHVWQATLGPDAVCFTTHPGPRRLRSPGHWTGSATLPRVAQVRNVVIALYHAARRPAVYVPISKSYTHAWLPRDRFDEVLERGGWIFARKQDGYLALRSRRPYHWQARAGEDRGREVVAPGRDNVWICELGRRATSGSFEAFADRIARAPVRFGRRCVRYDSPSEGTLEFGWRGPLRRDGAVVPLGDHPRYECPYVRAPFPLENLEVRCGDHTLRLSWEDSRRDASALL